MIALIFSRPVSSVCCPLLQVRSRLLAGDLLDSTAATRQQFEIFREAIRSLKAKPLDWNYVDPESDGRTLLMLMVNLWYESVDCQTPMARGRHRVRMQKLTSMVDLVCSGVMPQPAAISTSSSPRCARRISRTTM